MGLIASVNTPLVGNRYTTIQPSYLHYNILTNEVAIYDFKLKFTDTKQFGDFCIKIDPGLTFEVTKIETLWGIDSGSSIRTYIRIMNNIPVNPSMLVKTVGYDEIMDETVGTTINPFLTDMIVDNMLQTRGLLGKTSFFTYYDKPTNVIPRGEYLKFVDRTSYVVPYDSFHNIMSCCYFVICLFFICLGCTRAYN